jgi:peptidyl-prolyl cis-trans isomerase C
MQTLMSITKKLVVLLILFLILLSSACAPADTTPAVEEVPSPTKPLVTPTPEEPTAIPQPAAALVNGEPIPLTWFEREVERYLIAQLALGKDEVDETEARETVLFDLIDQVLLAQGARQAGANFSNEDVQARMDDLAAEIDLDAWMVQWGYTKEELMESLRLQMFVAYQRDAITDALPKNVEQVELQQVFAFTEAGANRALRNLNAGVSFDDVAFEFSPETGGYLGWIPRGYLLIPAVEEAAFNQPVGTYTEIVESDIGYHVVLVIDRESRPLSLDARLALERLALRDWLETQREESIIEVLIN